MDFFFDNKGASSVILNKNSNSKKEEIEIWAKKYKVIPEESNLTSYKDISLWTRAGAETYTAKGEFHFEYRNNITTKVILFKALTSLNPEKSLLDWSRRRSLLEKHDISVSNWYYAQDGLIVEDYYENNFSKVKNNDLLKQIGNILDKLGFSCLNYLEDLRCNNNGEVFYIDFGFDLGEPSEKAKDNCEKTFYNYYNKK